jgi:site-specific recombinase XerD
MYPQEEIDGFEQYWRRRKPGRSTAVHYRSDVNIFFQWAQQSPAAITVHHIDQFIDWQRELGRASATIQRRLIAIRMFYDYLAYIREEDVPNPVIPRRHYLAHERRLPRDIPDDVLAQLFEAIGSHLRDRTMFTLMLHAGLRVGEVSQLRQVDVRLSDKHTPFLRLNGKGAQERVVYLSATAAQLLDDYLKERPQDSPEQIFLNYKGQPISITGIQLRLAHYCRKVDIWITSHQLRHTYASRMIAADVPITSVQKLLGHNSIRTTQLYVRVADSKVEEDYHDAVSRITKGSLPEKGGTP